MTHASTPHSEYLTFRLGDNEYGIDILLVQEIRSYEQPSSVVNAPDYLRGVINLRGVIVPIIDLRLKFKCESAEYNAFTVVIVVNVRGHLVGAVVDSVSDVIELTKDRVSPAPELAPRVHRSYITGVSWASRGEGKCSVEVPLILLDIEKVLLDDSVLDDLGI